MFSFSKKLISLIQLCAINGDDVIPLKCVEDAKIKQDQARLDEHLIARY